MKKILFFIVIAFLVCTGISILFFFPAGTPVSAQEDISLNYKTVKEMLVNPGKLEGAPFSMRIICLSLISDGLRNLSQKDNGRREYLVKEISHLVNIAIGVSAAPYKNILDSDFTFSEHGLYLSHLNVILSNYYCITNDSRYKSFHEKLNNFLVLKIQSSKDFHIRSYPELNLKFPADNAVTVYSIWLYNKVYNTNKGKDAIVGWTHYIKNRIQYSSYNLPPSEVTGNVWYAEYPRGCATSYIVYYMSFFTIEDSLSIWNIYKNKFMGEMDGNILFREWVENPGDTSYTSALHKWKTKYGYAGDADSGPVILGYGAAATGLGLLAARGVHDEKIYNGLLESVAEGFDMLRMLDKNALKNMNPFMTASIMFAAETM